MNPLIEDYLHSRGVRYFRGHHDNEYFFLVDFLAGAHRGRLNVHLELCGAALDAVSVSIAPDRYYPADKRERFTELAARWNAGGVVEAVVHESSDPRLIGVLARSLHRPTGLADLTDFVEGVVTSAIELFGGMSAAAAPSQQASDALRDAG